MNSVRLPRLARDCDLKMMAHMTTRHTRMSSHVNVVQIGPSSCWPCWRWPYGDWPCVDTHDTRPASPGAARPASPSAGWLAGWLAGRVLAVLAVLAVLVLAVLAVLAVLVQAHTTHGAVSAYYPWLVS